MKQVGKKPGPKRLTYIPPQYRNIEGIEDLTTRRQLIRLKEYLEIKPESRAPYVRLGASVPQYSEENTAKPSATYVVMVDGKVSVILKNQDPRQAEKWFSCSQRPWNLAREFAEEVSR